MTRERSHRVGQLGFSRKQRWAAKRGGSAAAASSSVAIELLRVDQRLGDRRPVAVAGGAEEAGAAAGVAGDALLVDAEQQRVAVAIEPQLDQALDLARGLALAPQPAARARPVAGLPAGD